MRKYLTIALTAVLALAVVSFAFARDDIQTIKTKITPSKLDKKKFKNAKIFVDIDTVPDDELSPTLNQPPSATRTEVDFSRNLKFDTTAVPNCKVTAAEITNRSRDDAINLCGKDSVVSLDNGTDATLVTDLDQSGPGTDQFILEVAVTAFNGKEKNTLYLHTDPDDPVTTNPVLVGELKKGPQGFGKTLDVTVPGTPPFAISEFRTTVKAGGFVQARCKEKVATYQARTTYSNHTPTEATALVKCTQKKSKKGGKG